MTSSNLPAGVIIRRAAGGRAEGEKAQTGVDAEYTAVTHTPRTQCCKQYCLKTKYEVEMKTSYTFTLVGAWHACRLSILTANLS